MAAASGDPASQSVSRRGGAWCEVRRARSVCRRRAALPRLLCALQVSESFQWARAGARLCVCAATVCVHAGPRDWSSGAARVNATRRGEIIFMFQRLPLQSARRSADARRRRRSAALAAPTTDDEQVPTSFNYRTITTIIKDNRITNYQLIHVSNIST